MGLGDADYMQTRMSSAYRYYQRAFDIAADNKLLAIQAAAIPGLGYTKMFQNELAGARKVMEEGLINIRQVGHLRAEFLTRLNLASVLCDIGEPARAVEETNLALDAIQHIGAVVWVPYVWAVRARCFLNQNRRSEAIDASKIGAELARTGSRALLGAWCLGVVALTTDAAEERDAALIEGEQMLADGAVGHCHAWFFRDAMDASFNANDIDAVERYASKFEALTSEEPFLWGEYFIDRGRALSNYRKAPEDPENQTRLQNLIVRAKKANLHATIPTMSQLLN